MRINPTDLDISSVLSLLCPTVLLKHPKFGFETITTKLQMINSFNFRKSILLELADPYFTAYLIFCVCLLVMLVKFKFHYNVSLHCKENTNFIIGKRKSFLLMNTG